MRLVTAIVGSSVRLRDEALAPLRAEWTGEVKRVIEPDDLPRLLLDLDTPSLFGIPALWLVRGDGRWWQRHAELLQPLLGRESGSGALVMLSPDLDGRTSFAKALAADGGLIAAKGPDPRQAVDWTVERLRRHPQGVQDAQAVAATLVEQLGADADALLGAIDLCALYADPEPFGVEAARALFHGLAERPPWEMTGALFEGRSRQAIELLHAGEGLEPEQALATIANDLRLMQACLESPEDAEVYRLAGSKGRPFLGHVRRRAARLGLQALLRLRLGTMQTARTLRSSGADPVLALEMLVLNAQRVVRT